MRTKTAVLIITLDVVLSLVIFGVQAWQIHILNSQQAQLSQQNIAITLNAAKNDCWSAILDKALKTPTIDPEQKAALIKQARKCIKLPSYPLTVSGRIVVPPPDSG